jgi:hypothetical protein
MKVRPLSLIELLICLVLLSLITSSLFHLVSSYATYSAKLSQVKYEELDRQKCLFRLKALLLQSRGEIKETERGFKFSFENGIDPDPLFCHELKAEVMRRGPKLIASYGPDKDHQREEILYGALQTFAYELKEGGALLLFFNDKPYPLFVKP